MAEITACNSQFGVTFSEMFLDRIADKEVFAPLEVLERYQSKMQVYGAAHAAIFDTLDQSGTEPVQTLLTALYSVQDMQMEYIYRLGLQEGMRIGLPSFLTEGIQ